MSRKNKTIDEGTPYAAGSPRGLQQPVQGKAEPPGDALPVPGTGRGRVPDRPDPGAPDDGVHAAHGQSRGRCGCSRSRDSSQEAGVTPSLLENRVFVIGRDGKALDPCCAKRARKLVESGRAKHAGHRPWTIQLMDRWVGDGRTVVHLHEVRLDPGARRSGIAVVMRLEREDHVVYQEEVAHRRDISQRMNQRRGYRQGRTVWGYVDENS